MRDLLAAAAWLATSTLLPDAVAAATPGEFVVAERGVAKAEIAAGRDRYLAIWTDESRAELHARFLGTDGAPLGESFLVATGLSEWEDPRVASDGEERFLVIWVGREPRDLRGATIDGDGRIQEVMIREAWVEVRGEDGAPELEHRWIQSPVMSWTGTDWYLKWNESFADYDPVWHAARIDREARVDESEAFVRNGYNQWQIAWHENGACVAMESYDTATLWVAPVGADGTPGPWIEWPEEDNFESLASNGRDCLLTYFGRDDWSGLVTIEIDGSTGVPREHTRARVPGTTSVGGPWRDRVDVTSRGREWIVVRETAGTFEPDVIVDGERLLAASFSPRVAANEAGAVAIALRGESLIGRAFVPGTPFVPATPVPPPPPFDLLPRDPPVVLGQVRRFTNEATGNHVAVSARNRSLIAWAELEEDEIEVRGVLIDAAGTFEPVTIARLERARYEGVDSLAVATDGAAFALAWIVGSGQRTGYELHVARLDPQNAAVPNVTRLAETPAWTTDIRNARIAWDRGSWNVRWWQGRHVEARLHATSLHLESGPSLLESFSPDWHARLAHPRGRFQVLAASPTTFFRPDSERFLAVFLCEYRCLPDSPPSGASDPHYWAVELDSKTSTVLERTRRWLSNEPGRSADHERVAVTWMGSRWLIAREDRSDFHDPGVRVDDLLAFEQASDPQLAIVGTSGYVVVRRGASVVGRRVAFAGDAPPRADAEGTPERDVASGCSVSLARSPAGIAAALVVLALAWSRRRST